MAAPSIDSYLTPLPPVGEWPVMSSTERRPPQDRFASNVPVEGLRGALADSRPNPIDQYLKPVRTFDYGILQDTDDEKEALVRLWLGNTKFGAAQPKTVEELEAIKTRAEKIGMSLDDLIDEAEERQPFFERQASRLYRNGGPLVRGAFDSATSTITFGANVGARGLSYMPGLEWLSDWADENNRALDVSQGISETLDREGTLAQYISPTAASFLNGVGETGMDLATLYATKGVGMGATSPKAAAKAYATFYGLRRAQTELTVATDAGLSPGMRIAHATAMGGMEGALTYGFGAIASKFGLATSEEAMTIGRGAVDRLATRTGLSHALAGMTLEAGEEASIAAGQMLWGTYAGTDTLDAGFERIAKAAAIGGVTRGVLDIPPAVKRLRLAMEQTQADMPDTVRGTMDAQKAKVDDPNGSAVPPENETPAYKAAYQSKLEELSKVQLEVHSALEDIKIEERSLRDQVNDFVAARREFAASKDAENPELAPLTEAAFDEDAEALKAQRSALVERRKQAETAVKEAEKNLKALTKTQKNAALSAVQSKVGTKVIADDLKQQASTLQGARNEDTASYRKFYELSEVDETVRIAEEETLRSARAKGLTQKAVVISDEVLKTQRGIDSEEQAGMKDAVHRLTPEMQKAFELRNTLTPGTSDYNDADLLYRDIRNSIDSVTEALKVGAADPARMLGARSRTAAKSESNPANVRTTGKRIKGSDLTAQESDELTALALEIEGLKTRRDAIAKPDKTNPESEYNVLDYKIAGRQAMLELKLKKLEPKTLSSRTYGGLLGTHNLWRTWLTGFDLFPMLRQGYVHPIQAMRAAPSFFKALGSKKGAFLAQRSVNENPVAKYAEEVGLKNISEESPLALRDDALMSTVAEGAPILGPFQRAFRVYINKVRMDTFATYVNSLGGTGKVRKADGESIAKFVNIGTGHGDLLGFENSAHALAQLFIGPRYWASRMEYALGYPLWRAVARGDKTASKLMLKEYTKQVIGLSAFVGFAQIFGRAAFGEDAVDFFENPENPNFGRLRIGQTFIDITGGLGRPFRYIAGLTDPIRAKMANRPPMRDPNKVAAGIVTSNLSPAPAALVAAGRGYLSNKPPEVSASEFSKDYVLPWSFGAIIDAFKEEGVPAPIAISVLNLLGASGFRQDNK